MAGISLGVQQSLDTVISMLSSLVLHKCIEAAVLVVNLLRAGRDAVFSLKVYRPENHFSFSC